MGGIAALGAITWIGLRIPPQPLPDPGLDAGTETTVPLPDGLPAPVARFYTQVYGDQVPVIHSAVISGRGELRIAGITLPARYRFSHITGQEYRHYIETTIFGAPFLRVNEWYLDGTARLELPFGVSEGPEIDQGANLALWAEAGWMPSVWLTDPRARWEDIDDQSARLIVPFEGDEEHFTVHFDPQTGLLSHMESLRYKGEAGRDKTLWINEALEWGEIDGHIVPTLMTVTWADDGAPWATFRTEEVTYNADLSTDIERAGP